MTPTKKSCHGNTQNYTEEKYLNRIISVFSVCFRGQLGVFIGDTSYVSAIWAFQDQTTEIT